MFAYLSHVYALVVVWVHAHHAQLAYAASITFAVLNVLVKLALNVHPIPDWVTIMERNPRVAALVRLLGAVGIQPVAALQALVDFVRGHASPGTLASMRSFQVSASSPLIAPKDLLPGPPRLAPDGAHVEYRCSACGCTWALGGPRRCPICDDPQKVPAR